MPTDPLGNQSGISSVSQGFAPIYSMIGSGTPSGGGSGAFGLQPQGMSGNDLTQMGRSLTNLLGATGGQLGALGQGVLGAGLGAMQGGLQTLQTPLNFWNALASGDPTAMTQALAPQAAALSGITSGALQNVGQNLPRGGFSALAQANLPAAQAAQVGNAALGLAPTAAQQLQSLGGLQAQIGQGIGGIGTTLTGQGLQGLNAAEQAVLQKMHLNLLEPSPFQDIMGAIGTVAPILGGIGGLLSGGGPSVSGPGSNFGDILAQTAGQGGVPAATPPL